MPYNFKLPTTSFLLFQDYVTSNTHPSLPASASMSRTIMRDVLKKYKRLAPPLQPSRLTDVLACINDYAPFVLAIDAGLSSQEVAGEELEIILERNIQLEWRPVFTTGIPGRETPRIKLSSIEYEVLFTLSTLAATHCLLARSHLHSLFDTVTPSADQRATAISTAMKHFLDANSLYNYLLKRASQLDVIAPAPDISSSTFTALASYTLAEATLIAVLKDDPYPAAVAQDRNAQDKDWMFKAPEISSVRALLFARLCIAASDHASRGRGMVQASNKVVQSLPKYFDDLRSTARAKAFRFLAIDAELSSKTGEAIAWLQGARQELGFASVGGDADKKTKVFSRLKKDLLEKREDRKVEDRGDWGGDAGRFEEGRIVDMLMAKWSKMNSIMNVQPVPPFEPLLARLPSGREFHSPKPWNVPMLTPSILASMRSPPSKHQARLQRDEDDSDADETSTSTAIGAFPGAHGSYTSSNQYY